MAWYNPIYLGKRFVASVKSTIGGTYRNFRSLFGSFTFDEALPDGVEGVINEIIYLVPTAIGVRGAKKQVYASLTLAVLILITSVFSLGISLILLVIPMTTLAIGLIRMVPAINERYSSGLDRAGVERNPNVPLWRRK